MSEETEVQQQEESAVAEAAAAPAKLSYLPLNGGKVATIMNVDEQIKDHPAFSAGDTVKVHYRIKEGDKERVQVYEGTVIAMRGSGLDKTFVVRRVSHEIGVERIFPFHSPAIQKIETTRRGRVRRAKLFYLRHKSGKEGRIKEVFDAERFEANKKARKERKRRKKPEAKAAPATAPETAAPVPEASASTPAAE
ncbi:MAG: 50S ribosomal protein L19 [Leptospirales bacterium]|jgi:large subunit ribosomal protein L19